MRVSLDIFTDRTFKKHLGNFSGRVAGLGWSTGEHGSESCSGRLLLRAHEKFAWYRLQSVPFVLVSACGFPIWSGRMEDTSLQTPDFSFTALGGWRAYSDLQYTALWSEKRYTAWSPITVAEDPFYSTTPYTHDQKDRLQIALNKDEPYDIDTPSGGFELRAPNRGARGIRRVTFDYDLLLPVGWRAFASLINEAGFVSGFWELSATGATQVGSAVMTTLQTTSIRAILALTYDGPPSMVFLGATGTRWARFSNIRVLTVHPDTTTTLSPQEISKALVDYVYSINPTQVDPGKDFILSQGIDLPQEEYLDGVPADILTYLASLGDNKVPARRWEVGVHHTGKLYLRPQNEYNRQWQVDAQSLTLERSLDSIHNAVYTVYRDASGRMVRTVTSVDSTGVSRTGIRRDHAFSASTDSISEALRQRDAHLKDHIAGSPQASIVFSKLYDMYGNRVPLYLLKAGDTVTVRNLPPIGLFSGTPSLDRARSFRVAHTQYNAESNTLEITPEGYLPRLEWILLRQEAGVHSNLDWRGESL